MSASTPIDYLESSSRWMGRRLDDLDSGAHRAVEHLAQHRAITGDPVERLEAQATVGERLADRVAAFGGSWRFIMLFGVALVMWAVLNTEILGPTAFDPYPFIFLNLMLSMLAALQAPVIMMSQNRHAAKDRQMASYDYEVNLKAELEIMALHEKVDALRDEQVVMLLRQQQVQIDLLTRLLAGASGPDAR